MSEEAVRAIGLAAHVHDVGKIGVRDEVLLKEGPLSPDERRLMEEHPVLGERILAPTELEEVLPLVRHHHERWDGSGYPDGLRGPQIPVGARILAVCDAFEAMTSLAAVPRAALIRGGGRAARARLRLPVRPRYRRRRACAW